MPLFSEDAGLERADALPLPEGFYGAISTRTVQTTADGAAHVADRAIEFNRVIVRATTGGAARFVSFGIFQAPLGGDGVADLIALVTNFAAATGNWVMTMDDGLVKTLRPGIFYVLYNRATENVASIMRTYVGGSMDLVTANVDSGTHPLVFTVPTATEGAFPSTLNPRTDFTASTLDLALTIRLKKV